MNDAQENKLSMYNSVKNVNGKNQAAVDSLPALKTADLSFIAKIAEIESAKEVQALTTKGYTLDKALKLISMVNFADKIIGGGSAFARVKNDTILLENINFSRSTLLYGRDQDAYTNCMKVYNELTPFVGELADYGITPEMMTDYLAMINVYNDVLQNPRAALTEKMSATQQLVDLFKDGDGILKIMDGLVKSFRDTNVTYYNEYFAAREIIDLGVRHTKPTA